MLSDPEGGYAVHLAAKKGLERTLRLLIVHGGE